jgi:hypothetical protein
MLVTYTSIWDEWLARCFISAELSTLPGHRQRYFFKQSFLTTLLMIAPVASSQQRCKMPKKRISLSSPSFCSSSSGVGGGGSVWLDVQEDGELKGGTKLVVTMNKI